MYKKKTEAQMSWRRHDVCQRGYKKRFFKFSSTGNEIEADEVKSAQREKLYKAAYLIFWMKY